MAETKVQLPQQVIDFIADITEDFVGQGKLFLVTAICTHTLMYMRRTPELKAFIDANDVDVVHDLLTGAARDRLGLYEDHVVVEYRLREDGSKVMAIVSSPNPKTGEYPAVSSDDIAFSTVFIPDFLSLEITTPDVKIQKFMEDAGVATHLSAAHDTLLADCGVEGAHCLRPHTGCDIEAHPDCGTRKSALRLGDACVESLKRVTEVAHEEAAYSMEHCRFAVLNVSASIVVSTDVVSDGAAQIMELSGPLIDAQKAGTISPLGAAALAAMKAYSQSNRAVIPTIIHAGGKMDLFIALKEQMGVDTALRDAFMKVFGAMFRPSAIAIPKEAVTELLDKIGLAQAGPVPADPDDNDEPTFH